MRNAAVFIALGLAAGFAVSALLPGGRDLATRRADEPLAPSGQATEPRPPPLPLPLPLPSPATTLATVPDDAVGEPEVAFDELEALLDLEPVVEQREPSLGPQTAGARRSLERLIAAGFEPERAAAIIEQEASLRAAAATAELETTGTVFALSMSRGAARTDALRDALGDADYERYLDANGRSTHVRIGGVEPDSPAAHAGLEAGDLVVAYAGRRVFNLRDLNQLMLGGTTGETVATTVIRDGQPLQLYVTRGALGITEGITEDPSALP